MTSDIQILARAIELHETRKANRARRDPYSAELMVFDGAERELCIQSARETLEIEAHDAAIKTHEDRWYEEQFAAMSDADIEFEIARIDREVAYLPYAPLTVNIEARKRAFMKDRSRCVAEQLRRSIALDSVREGSEHQMEAAQ